MIDLSGRAKMTSIAEKDRRFSDDKHCQFCLTLFNSKIKDLHCFRPFCITSSFTVFKNPRCMFIWSYTFINFCKKCQPARFIDAAHLFGTQKLTYTYLLSLINKIILEICIHVRNLLKNNLINICYEIVSCNVVIKSYVLWWQEYRNKEQSNKCNQVITL